MFEHKTNMIINFILYNIIWFAAVLGNFGYEWLVFGLIVIHFIIIKKRVLELKIMIFGASLGFGFDNIMSALGYYQFNEETLLPAPFWLLGIWLGFCGTLLHSLYILVKKPILLTLMGCISAPLSYIAARKFGAVSFSNGDLNTALIIGLFWLILIPILIWYIKFLEKG